MIQEIFEQRFASLTPRQEEKTTALVEAYRQDVADVHSTALRIAQGGGVPGVRALSLIGQLNETGAEAVASSLEAQEEAPETSLVIDLVKGVIFAETAVVAHLKVALHDNRVAPQPPAMRVMEEVGRPHRICDEAYTALRKILNRESLLQYLAESRHFLSLPDAARNREIEGWLETGSFTRFLGDVDTEEE